LLFDGLNSSEWGNPPTGVTAITESPNTVPSDDVMIKKVMNTPMVKTESIFCI
jgi:hypothetical protein